MARLQEKFVSEIMPEMAKKCGRTNVHSLPKLEKIVISMGLGRAATQGEKGKMEEAQKHLSQITGQRPLVTTAKKSIAAFRLREGMKVGLKVTLRGARMYEFIDRLVSVALPRVRDFRGVSTKSFDGSGNYNLGLNDQTIFPEINADTLQFYQGMNVTFVINNSTDEESLTLLRHLGMPFRH